MTPGRRRVQILGNSVTMMVVPRRASRAEGTYAEFLEAALDAAGCPAEVTVSGRWDDLVTDGERRWMEELRTRFPDVLVVQYGTNEMQPWVMPAGLRRHFITWRTAQWGIGGWYRRRVAPGAWRRLRHYQRVASAAVGERTWRLRPDRFARSLERLVRLAREDGVQVLVLDVNPPGPRMVHAFPGLDLRHGRIQDAVREVVKATGDDGVRLVEVSTIVEDLGAEVAIPDGIHYSVTAHRAVAGLLAAEIVPFLEDERGSG